MSPSAALINGSCMLLNRLYPFVIKRWALLVEVIPESSELDTFMQMWGSKQKKMPKYILSKEKPWGI